ncbi:MAG TPA: hypothetical protein VGF99_15750, partial [Myxococcota bacterium]
MRRRQPARGYALILVLLVLALLSVGIGTFFVYMESSAKISNSLIERRRVFYACDGIGRATTVLAQQYVLTAQPTTAGLITSVCTAAGGGCCPTTTDTTNNVSAGACSTDPTASYTRLQTDPASSSTTAMPLIVPPGFKVMDLDLRSVAPTCTTDSQCQSGTCVGGRCRTVGALPNGPFAGMNARQDTISFGLAAEHAATSGFRCTTNQTLTLGKIAMFQFFLFSDSAVTDWHPGPAMRASGRLHANGDLHVNGNLRLQRVTASGDLRVYTNPGAPCTGDCTATAAIANVSPPDFSQASNFTTFKRKDTSWRDDALLAYANNALDKAHGVPRLQLPITGSPRVQRGHDGRNNVIDNTNSASGVALNNARLLVDPVRAGDTPDIIAQKFSEKADIRIINGVWYLNTTSSTWPGMPIWSDHGTYITTVAADFVANVRAGQAELRTDRGWGTHTPRRYSYYAMKRDTDALILDDAPATAPNVRAVVSYGSLFRDVSGGEDAPVWKPGVRSLNTGSLESFCEAAPTVSGSAFYDVSHVLLDALAIDGSAASVCPAAFKRSTAVIAATRSGFRDGFGEHFACGGNDANDSVGSCTEDRRKANIVPLNFDLGAFQQALADTSTGELGSYFCTTGGPCAMHRPFNGIIWISNPYPGSENGYGADGGTDRPDETPAPTNVDTGLMPAVTSPATIENDTTPGAVGNWLTTGPLALLRNNPMQPTNRRAGTLDDEALAVPYPLCSRSTTAGTRGLPGTSMATSGWVFNRPLCEQTTAARTTWVTGVRVINARVVNSRVKSETPPSTLIENAGNITPFTQALALAQLPNTVKTIDNTTVVDPSGQLPNGITIASNQGMYSVGDVNITSDAFKQATTQPGPWVPVLFVGDTYHPFSNAWDDRKARWGVSMQSSQLRTGTISRVTSTAITRRADGGTPREARVTRWYMQVLSGWSLPVAGAAATGIHNYPFFNENWA